MGVLLLLPLSAPLRGVPLSEVPAILADGLRCLAGGLTACGAACTGAPLLPLCYVCVNIAFNILALLLVRSVGTVAAGLVLATMVPLSLAAFALLPLPLLPPAVLGPGFGAGATLLVVGLLGYNASGLLARKMQGLQPPPPPPLPPPPPAAGAAAAS